MSNIFEGLTMISDEVIILQVSLLELVKNKISIPVIDKANNNFNKISHSVTKLFQSKESLRKKQSELYGFLETKKEKYKMLKRYELNQMLHDQIKLLIGYNNEDVLSDDQLSIRVIDQASTLFNASVNELPSEKADKVFRGIYDYLIDTTEEIKELYRFDNLNNGDFENTLRNLNEKDKDKLVEILNLQQYLMILPDYKVSRGNNIYNKEIFSIIVFLSLLALGGKLINIDTFKENDEDSSEEIKYSKLVRKNKNIEYIKASNTNNISRLNKEIDECKKKINKLLKKESETKNKIEELSNSLDKLSSQLEKSNIILDGKDLLSELDIEKENAILIENKKHENLSDNYKSTQNSLEYQKKALFWVAEKIKNTKKFLNSSEEKIKELSIENKSLGNTKDKSIQKLTNEQEIRKDRIKESWHKQFPKFTFESFIFIKLSKFEPKLLKFTKKSIFELYSASDYSAISQGVNKRNKYYFTAYSDNIYSSVKISYSLLFDKDYTVEIDSIEESR